jgi:hypothetical protein
MTPALLLLCIHNEDVFTGSPLTSSRRLGEFLRSALEIWADCNFRIILRGGTEG